MVRKFVRYVRGGKVVTLDQAAAGSMLLDHLRLDLNHTGTKEGCNEGDCGACTVVLARLRDGVLVHEAVNSCILLAGQVDGAELISVENLAPGATLHPVQQAMVDQHASQCGFCTPGIVMSLFSLYHEAQRPVDRRAVTEQLQGNLCRCTGYRPIVDAALSACAGAPSDRFAATDLSRREALAGLADDEDVFVGDETRFFAAPRRIESLARLLDQHSDAVLVAGATDVGLWITKKLKDLPKIIWLGRLREFGGIEDNAEALKLGAGVSLARALPHLAAIDSDLGEVMRRFGSRQVRASGTVGGNIANGSPIGDLAPCLIALDAEVSLQKGEVQRVLPLEEFFIAYGKQDRLPGEFVRMLTVPKLANKQRFRAYKVSKRFDEDISSVLGAFRFELDSGRIVAARVAFGGMAATPRRAAMTEAALMTATIDDAASWENAVEALGIDFQPISDMRASGAYRLSTARALLQKALFEMGAVPSAVTRVRGIREQRP